MLMVMQIYYVIINKCLHYELEAVNVILYYIYGGKNEKISMFNMWLYL